MKQLNKKIKTIIIGAAAGGLGIPLSSACNGTCTACGGCFAIGGLTLLSIGINLFINQRKEETNQF